MSPQRRDDATTPHGFLRVGAACPPVRVADPAENLDAIVRFVARARDENVQALVLPELALTGYSCGDLFFSSSTLRRAAGQALATLCERTAKSSMVIVVGTPWMQGDRLFNAAAVLQSGRLRGVVPKTYLPGYKEYYEERWFSSAREAVCDEVVFGEDRVPFGTDVLFGIEGDLFATLAVEICEDLWVPVPPSSLHALAGATLILTPSASNELVAKAEYRRELLRQQSGRALCGYVYANCGVHESTTDVVFGGHLIIAENGVLLAESKRFEREGELIIADVDLERVSVERVRQTSFADGTPLVAGHRYRRVPLDPIPTPAKRTLCRAIEAHPFVPSDPATLDERCHEIFSIQTAGLAKRLSHTGLRRVTLGVSGGLDSTLALLVAVRTFELLALPPEGILALTMPGFGTTKRTLGNARRLTQCLGVSLREIDISAACRQHIADIGLDPGDTESAAYQNLQARERTQVLMDIANKEQALVVGTADLSEIALGFSTFAGDHISMYNVNASVPKTLVRCLVQWVGDHRDSADREILKGILETPVSPELLPARGDGSAAQETEEIVGPYELHDFFLFHFVRWGSGPRKILLLAEQAFRDRYDRETLKRWLRVFVTRFFSQQFKRSVFPDGPKVGSVSLSPRGDWRMPSDASAGAWLAELDD